MNRDEQLLSFFISSIPQGVPVTVPLLTKLMYLADWKSAIHFGRTISSLSWDLDGRRPSTSEVETLIRKMISTNSLKGYSWRPPSDRNLMDTVMAKRLTRVQDYFDQESETLQQDEIDIAKSVLKLLSESDAVDRIVDATYPVSSGQLGDAPDLQSIASVYKRKATAFRSACNAASDPDADKKGLGPNRSRSR